MFVQTSPCLATPVMTHCVNRVAACNPGKGNGNILGSDLNGG